MQTLRFISLATVLASCLMLSGCGGNGTFSPAVSTGGTVTPIVVTVSPASLNLFTGDTQQYTVTVTGTSNHGVQWSVSASNSGNPGTITSNGFYTAPNSIFTSIRKPPGDESETITITATSNADPESTGTATINLSQSNDG